MLRYTANYSHTNHNFVIQNLDGKRTTSHFLPAICILKNILQRGTPTMMSAYLQESIGNIHEEPSFKHPLPLISQEPPRWLSRIRGDDKSNYYPARDFLYDLISQYLPDYSFIQQLILPEAEINEITQVDVANFNTQRVDFFLPQARLVVEVDGQHHKINDRTRIKDGLRDKHLAAYGVQTVRIDTRDLAARNAKFISRIEAIKNRLNEFHGVINHYRGPFDQSDKAYCNSATREKLLPTAIMRFQLLILELLERDKLQCDALEWKLNVLERDVRDFVKLAIDDIFLWLKHICKLQHLEFREPALRISEIFSEKKFAYQPDAINIDFSLLKRWTDENTLNPYWIIVRTDYYDYQKGNRDYGKLSVTDPIRYNIIPYSDSEDIQSLRFMLKNIFAHDDFKEGQLRIITNALSLRHTIGLLPTSGGKSLCYQLASLLQPAISFVVCPIKSLMYDQKYNLDKVFIDRTAYITSDQESEVKSKVAADFAKGRYSWIWISPERLQSQDFRDQLDELNKNLIISYAIIDEVHCLSEWGHDFRTSYLNLSKTINRYLPASTFIGLTATASIHVLKDIKTEFEIKEEDIKTLTQYSRPELEFRIINSGPDKKATTVEILKRLFEEYESQQPGEEINGCGLIFTPHVNGTAGCHDLANDLSRELKRDVRWFSGAVPKKKMGRDKKRLPVLTAKEFNSYKMAVHDDFQKNKYHLLVATKAFGMGVNKENIRYTIHYGIPGSMESLYQEAGRAGRDGKPASCYVIFSPEIIPKEVLDKVFGFETRLKYIRDVIAELGADGNDAFRVLYLWLSQQQEIDEELAMIMKVKALCQSVQNSERTIVAANICTAKGEEPSRVLVEKAIYRLSILGIVEDWTVSDWFRGIFTVHVTAHNTKTVIERLARYIKKYDPEFLYEKAVEPYLDRKEDEQPVLILLQWIYNHFSYSRRQSIKNVYERCEEYATKGPDAAAWFKKELESMFKFSEVSHALDEIAENPTNIARWFSIFYADQDDDSKKIINKDELHSLKSSLSRFLESYQFNTGLNMISGIVRLLVDDFDNIDGRQRMASALKHICNSKEYDYQKVIRNLLKIGSHLSKAQKEKLSFLLIEFVGEKAGDIYEALEDDASLELILDNANKRLAKIGGILYDRCEETAEHH